MSGAYRVDRKWFEGERSSGEPGAAGAVSMPDRQPSTGRVRMGRSRWWLPMLCLLALQAQAQEVVRNDEFLHADRPEAWAMNRVAAASLLTAFGETPRLAPGQWAVAAEAGSVPRLSETQRRVGFDGDKIEDLNKSPAFARLRFQLGLSAGWVAELGYTPPLAINGARPHNLLAASIGRRLFERGAFSLSARAFGQHGAIDGDITCPRELENVTAPQQNPYGCEAASNDRISVNDYGVDATAGWNAGHWHWHATGGVVRTELQVQVDALTFGFRDRSRLVADGVLRYAALGVRRDFGSHWSVGTELLHVPLDVRRGPGADVRSELFTSWRVQLRYAR